MWDWYVERIQAQNKWVSDNILNPVGDWIMDETIAGDYIKEYFPGMATSEDDLKKTIKKARLMSNPSNKASYPKNFKRMYHNDAAQAIYSVVKLTAIPHKESAEIYNEYDVVDTHGVALLGANVASNVSMSLDIRRTSAVIFVISGLVAGFGDILIDPKVFNRIVRAIVSDKGKDAISFVSGLAGKKAELLKLNETYGIKAFVDLKTEKDVTLVENIVDWTSGYNPNVGFEDVY